MNLCIFSGKLVADPELKYVPSGTAVVNFCIAVNRRFKDNAGNWQDEAAFLEMEAWDSAAENISRNWRKADGIIVECSVKQRTYTDKETNKNRRVTYYRVNRFEAPPRKEWHDNGDEEVEPVGAGADEKSM